MFRKLLPGALLERLILLSLGLVSGFIMGRGPSTELISAPVLPKEPWIKLTPDMRRGATGAGGYFSVWSAGSENGPVAEHIEYQYAGMRHQTETAVTGMWLFLATEVLFFGGLFLLYLVYRQFHSVGFAKASQHAQLAIGTINTVLLLTSSAVFAYGAGRARVGDNRMLLRAALMTAALGIAFLLLKGYEWKLDLDDGLFPGPRFSITGNDAAGAQLFWCFYFVATGLHGIHMIVGVALVTWITWTARRRLFSPGYYGPVEVVGLYWSFVDMVWLCLYPMIYLVHPGAS
jgi:cytochrome c oxidase subunit 3